MSNTISEKEYRDQQKSASFKNTPTVTYRTAIPDCDVCKEQGRVSSAKFDIRMKRSLGGRWANLCSLHASELSDGQLGEGLGQEIRQKPLTAPPAVSNALLIESLGKL